MSLLDHLRRQAALPALRTPSASSKPEAPLRHDLCNQALMACARVALAELGPRAPAMLRTPRVQAVLHHASRAAGASAHHQRWIDLVLEALAESANTPQASARSSIAAQASRSRSR